MPLAFQKTSYSPQEKALWLREVWSLLFALVLLVFPFPAWSADATLGTFVCNLKSNLGAYPFIVNVVSYIMGTFLGIKAILLFRKHAENPAQSQVTSGSAHLLGAAALMSLPSFVKMLQQSLFNTAGGGGSFGCSPGDVAKISSDSSVGLDQMMQSFVKNLYSPMFTLIALASISIGLTFIVSGLLRAAKTGTNPQAADPKLVVANLIFGAIMISAGTVLPGILQSLFGSSDVSKMTSVTLVSWSKVVGSDTDTTAADNTVRAVLAFIQIVGGLAFVRGWYIMKKAVEGAGQATMQQGLTHIIGGAMAINIDVMLKLIDTTFGTGVIK